MPTRTRQVLEERCKTCDSRLVRMTTIFQEPFPADSSDDLIQQIKTCKCGYNEVERDDLELSQAVRITPCYA